MSSVKYRRRGTAIVDASRGILLVAGRHGSFILPGGGANRNESRFMAALRELTEETGLKPYHAQIVFHHTGGVNRSFGGGRFQDHHTVCMVKASGVPRLHDDAKRIDYWFPGCHLRVSRTTMQIIERYLEWKRKGKAAESDEILDEDGSTEDAEDKPGDDYDEPE